jgi:hypothetical protein
MVIPPERTLPLDVPTILVEKSLTLEITKENETCDKVGDVF